MAVPSWINVSAKATGTTSATTTLPSGWAQDDILLCFVETANDVVSINQGYVAVLNSPQGVGTPGAADATRLSIFWKRAGASETAPVVTNDGSDNHVIACVAAIRGCTTSGNPWDVGAGDTASANTIVTIPGATTTVADCLILVAVSNGTDSNTAQTGSWANTNLANPSCAEAADQNTTAGNGGGYGVARGGMASAGDYGATSATLNTSSTQAKISLALKPPSVIYEYGAATLSGIGGVSGVAKRTRRSTGTLIGAGVMATVSKRIRRGVGTLSGTGVLAGIGKRILRDSVTLQGLGSVSAIGTVILGAIYEYGSATLSGAGQLVVTARRTLGAKVNLAGAGYVMVFAKRLLHGVASLTGQGGLTVAGVVYSVVYASVTLLGAGQLIVRGIRIRFGRVVLSGTGLLLPVSTLLRKLRLSKSVFSQALTIESTIEEEFSLKSVIAHDLVLEIK